MPFRHIRLPTFGLAASDGFEQAVPLCLIIIFLRKCMIHSVAHKLGNGNRPTRGEFLQSLVLHSLQLNLGSNHLHACWHWNADMITVLYSSWA